MFSDLNSDQQQAVKITSGPLMIIAGPGTGKTKTLVAKIDYLLHDLKISPGQIVTLTFTQKAALEIKNRLSAFSGPLPFVGTIHALCFDILAARSDFSVCDESRKKIILHDLFPQKNLKDLISSISLFKNQLSSDPQIIPLVTVYNQKLQELKLLDFDDLLTGVDRLDPSLLPKYPYILIDEFQDTSLLQYRLIQKLLAPSGHLTVIGDPLQSIYSFRGADPRIFNYFVKDYPHAKTIVLNTNYRSGVNLIALSHQLFPVSPLLKPSFEFSSEAKLITTLDRFTQTDWIINYISRQIGGLNLNTSLHSDSNSSFSDYALVYRTHHQNKIVKQKFNRSGIPFQVVGEGSFIEAPEINKIIESLRQLDQIQKQTPLSLLVNNLIDQFGYRRKFSGDKDKLALIAEFSNLTLQFESSPNSLSEFLNYLDRLIINEGYNPHSNQVSLLTIHAAKGLEFKTVFLVDFEADYLPYSPDNLDEEKRLLYVALTRAKKNLYLFTYKHPSPFLATLRCPQLLEVKDDNLLSTIFKRHQYKLKKSQIKLL